MEIVGWGWIPVVSGQMHGAAAAVVVGAEGHNGVHASPSLPPLVECTMMKG